MPAKYELVVPGDPVPWSPAVKLGSAPNAPRRMPGRQERHAGLIRQVWEDTHGGGGIWLEKGTAVQVIGHFYVTRPKTTHYCSGKKERLLKDSAPAFPTGKPDLSNLLKMVEDALTKTLWADDDQVVDLSGSKRFVDWWQKPYSRVWVVVQ